MLNTYFDVISKEIIRFGGIIDKFVGDEVMAVFKNDFHLEKAIEASLSVISQIEKLQPVGTNKYHPNVAIGINSGEMISGNIGSAAIKRLDFTVIGDVVNTAKRLQSIAREGEIIIPESCNQLINKSFSTQRVGDLALKNKTKTIVAYRVLS